MCTAKVAVHIVEADAVWLCSDFFATGSELGKLREQFAVEIEIHRHRRYVY
ncbi:hypothetical protein [Mycobacterium lepromatosis]|uniref:hypothetical protein n=1 Tax=Mycobacterium lepromatosis TaxID=480418 RepID=UPI0012E00957|nr:hypothetical protein [Mycobacterium lepromatosis]